MSVIETFEFISFTRLINRKINKQASYEDTENISAFIFDSEIARST